MFQTVWNLSFPRCHEPHFCFVSVLLDFCPISQVLILIIDHANRLEGSLFPNRVSSEISVWVPSIRASPFVNQFGFAKVHPLIKGPKRDDLDRLLYVMLRRTARVVGWAKLSEFNTCIRLYFCTNLYQEGKFPLVEIEMTCYCKYGRYSLGHFDSDSADPGLNLR